MVLLFILLFAEFVRWVCSFDVEVCVKLVLWIFVCLFDLLCFVEAVFVVCFDFGCVCFGEW